MREIEFRGKDFHGDWKYGDLIKTNGSTGDGYAIQYDDQESGWMMEDVQMRSIGQFTGYVDSMNVRIYEGDVLHVFIHEYDQLGRFKGKTDMPPYLRGVVVYNERMCKFEILMEENTQCEDHHILSCEIGWGHEQFLVVGKFIEMPFKLERDRDYKKDIDKVMEQEE